MLRKVDRILVRVPSLESAVTFYRDVFGLRLVKQDARLANLRLADCDTELVLHADADLPNEAIYYLVDDVRDLYRRRAALRLTFVSPPAAVSRGYRATVKDPFGNVLLLLDRTAAADSPSAAAVEDAKTPAGLFAGVEVRAPVKKDQLLQA
jgi:catechol 2,3-dioxygenase-like lactoylglutathione lyase family enzyme